MTNCRKTSLRHLTGAAAPVSLLGSALFLFPFTPAAQDLAPAAPITIAAGSEWVPLNLELDIVAGSALDFSRMGLLDPPAGKHGRVIARRDGQFAFDSNPGVARRFYGVNLCFGAQYLQHEEADRLAERLARLGYNSVRLHHYEGLLARDPATTASFNPERLDQLDYLFHALTRRGIYITTDLFTSRPVTFREIGIDREGAVGMDHFKVLVPVHEGAWENWKQFSRALLDHINPYTKRRYSDDPALAWLSLINEGNFGNFISDIRAIPEWQKAWNAWLAKRYGDRAALAAAWPEELKDDEDPAGSTVAMPESLSSSRLRVRDCIEFLTATEVSMTKRMMTFLRAELGCHALVTNTNSWTNHVTGQGSRNLYDYVDDHFYVDHPRFLEKSWQLPSRCPNTSPVARGAAGGRDRVFTRLFDKPFTITEYNYSGPGRFRGVGGILTGALGALQGWGGIWRFAYSHNRESILEPARMGYFDMAADPLGQASERASLCLFLRGDMKTAPHRVVVAMTPEDLASPPARIPLLAPRWHWAAWLTRLGTQVIADPESTGSFTAVLPLAWKTPGSAYSNDGRTSLQPYETDDAGILSVLKERGIVSDLSCADPAKMIFRSETGEILLDGPRDVMILDTPRTAGGYAPAGQTIQTRDGGLTITMAGSDATVWVNALDNRPIVQSRRLLVTHLTDLQNTEIKYAEEARQTLLDWGKLPHLVRAGKADLSIRMEDPAQFRIWAISTSGKRVGEVYGQAQDGRLRFEVDVSGNRPAGARMMYEIGRR